MYPARQQSVYYLSDMAKMMTTYSSMYSSTYLLRGADAGARGQRNNTVNGKRGKI